MLKLKDEDDTDTGFVCAGEGELIFTSERPVIAWLLLGSMKALTKSLYDVDVSIVIEPVEGDPRRYRYLFTLPVGAVDAAPEEVEKVVEEEDGGDAAVTSKPDLKMNPATFCKAFPWHFVMNEDLELVQIGMGFSKLYKSSLPTHGRLATTYFEFKRPIGLTVEFREIIRRSNTPFVIALMVPPGKVDFPSQVCLKALLFYLLTSTIYLSVISGSRNQRPNGVLPRIEHTAVHRITISGRPRWADVQRSLHIGHSAARRHPRGDPGR